LPAWLHCSVSRWIICTVQWVVESFTHDPIGWVRM
jgi:hypothetical protein